MANISQKKFSESASLLRTVAQVWEYQQVRDAGLTCPGCVSDGSPERQNIGRRLGESREGVGVIHTGKRLRTAPIASEAASIAGIVLDWERWVVREAQEGV